MTIKEIMVDVIRADVVTDLIITPPIFVENNWIDDSSNIIITDGTDNIVFNDV